MTGPLRFAAAALGATIACALVAPVRAQVPTQFKVVFSQAVSDYANQADVSAAIAKWTSFIGNLLEPGRPLSHIMVADAAGVVTAVHASAADFSVMTSLEFLEVESRLEAEPLMTYRMSAETQTRYVLVTTAGVTSLAALAGRSLQLLNANAAPQPSALWLEVLLAEAKLPPPARHFSDLVDAKKATQALLAVYFGRSQAALVPRDAYLTALELNPDVGRKVTVLATSPPLLRTVVCASRRIDARTRTRWSAALGKAHEQPAAAQLFTLFKVDRFVTWEPGLLDNVRALVARHAALGHGLSAHAARMGTRP